MDRDEIRSGARLEPTDLTRVNQLSRVPGRSLEGLRGGQPRVLVSLERGQGARAPPFGE